MPLPCSFKALHLQPILKATADLNNSPFTHYPLYPLPLPLRHLLPAAPRPSSRVFRCAPRALPPPWPYPVFRRPSLLCAVRCRRSSPRPLPPAAFSFFRPSLLFFLFSFSASPASRSFFPSRPRALRALLLSLSPLFLLLLSSPLLTWAKTKCAIRGASVGSKARLALALLLYTAQRRSDVVRWDGSTFAMASCMCVSKRPGDVGDTDAPCPVRNH